MGTCTICQDNIKASDDNIKLLPREQREERHCGHKFHKHCLTAYKQLYRQGCPICRNKDFKAVITDKNGTVTIEKEEYARRFDSLRFDVNPDQDITNALVIWLNQLRGDTN